MQARCWADDEEEKKTKKTASSSSSFCCCVLLVAAFCCFLLLLCCSHCCKLLLQQQDNTKYDVLCVQKIQRCARVCRCVCCVLCVAFLFYDIGKQHLLITLNAVICAYFNTESRYSMQIWNSIRCNRSVFVLTEFTV
jgi:hypothetical protein